MGHRTRVVWDESLAGYDFGPGHPMAPVRVELMMRLARDLGVLDRVEITPAVAADDGLLSLAHDQAYVEAVRACSDGHSVDYARSLGTPDNPTFPYMHGVTSRIVGATVTAAGAVLDGAADHAFSPSGGLHHGMRDHASGFCIYNDVAVAIRWLLARGVERVAYVDVDVHHGDGVEAAFWDDPRVLTISLHESPRTLFPGTGYAEDIGGPGAEGMAVNVPLAAGTGDEDWLRAFHSVVPHLLEAFAPTVLVSQHGCDSHFLDPLAHFALSLDGQRTAYAALHRYAHAYADGRWLATGGGGYAVVDVVPRAWTHLMAEMSGVPVDPATSVPEGWREYVLERLSMVAPFHMTDGRTPEVTDWARGFDPASPVDRVVLATRRAVFPHHGLDPLRD